MWYHLDIFQKPKSKQIIHWYICTLYLWQGSVGFLIIFCLTFVALLNLKTTWLSPLGYVLLPMFLCSNKQILGGGGYIEISLSEDQFFFWSYKPWKLLHRIKDLIWAESSIELFWSLYFWHPSIRLSLHCKL